MDVPSALEPLPPYFTIGRYEGANIVDAMRSPLSGYLGGIHRGGYWVERLADEWCKTFGCKYAIPCNSATSGLLAACLAAGIGPGSVVWTTAYSMSATAACAKVLGAHIVFIDIEPMRFSMNMNNFGSIPPKAIIVTNLFGHPAYLKSMRSWCDSNKVVMIEDNAQSPFAMEGNSYAGTIGHIGVFSLNVHKHIQSGEGGVACTNDGQMGDRLRDAINHGELAKAGQTGLNLRMTEPIAAVACAQLKRAPALINTRQALAEQITDMFLGVHWVRPQRADFDCTHVYYHWAALVEQGRRDRLVESLRLLGVPMRKGYSPPLHKLFNSGQRCPVTDRVEDNLMTFEICAYDPQERHLKKMREIVKYAVCSIYADIL